MEISISVWDDISIHALRKESDRPVRPKRASTVRFQSTLSVRRATQGERPARGDDQISIHALRKESDRLLLMAWLRLEISIHALRKESDSPSSVGLSQSMTFQSTLSVRRATVQLDIFVHFLRRKPAAWL